jgi:predicted SAM-dependent methyltransferase
MNYLNLGCGSRFHGDWTNVNFVSTGEGVIAHDLTQGIPFPDRSFEVVYNSHVLEHFPQAEAQSFIQECYRVLRPEGILRVVVPDLEEIARMYLYSLEQASDGIEDWEQNYQWMLLEMYDQTTRNQSGGKMQDFLSCKELANQDFVVKRCGVEIENIIVAAQQQTFSKPVNESNSLKLLRHIYRLLRYADYRRQLIIKFMLSPTELNALQIGQFRQSGEIHQWMYDRHSLSKLLHETGFTAIVQRTATESYLPNWSNFNLDTETDGSIYKPDSLFMEATKPTA